MPAAARRIRVMVIDDSAVVRVLLSEMLASDPGVEVVGTAPNASIAREKLARLEPDVVTLDIDMPGQSGLSFLGDIMRTRPVPVIMVSGHTEEGTAQTLRALELGAVDFLTKPTADSMDRLPEIGAELLEKVRAAARSRLRHSRPTLRRTPRSQGALLGRSEPVIVVGASTGGVNALQELLLGLPEDAPGVVIAQHMPPGFTKSFADRCDSFCPVRVREAQDGDPVLRGQALIAPGGSHVLLSRGPSGYHVNISQAPKVNGHRPSVDVLFESAARCAGADAVGVILTGMGRDGAQGLLQMKLAGARTIAQDEATCVVFGMPQEAIALGAADQVLPLDAIPTHALLLAERRRTL